VCSCFQLRFVLADHRIETIKIHELADVEERELDEVRGAVPV
jgi:hypothetical protein